MKYTANLNAEQISTLKEHGELRHAIVTNESGFSEKCDLVVRDNKVVIRSYPRAHFTSVIVVDDNALVLTQSEAKKLRKIIEEQGEYVKFDNFKQYTDSDLKRADVQKWLKDLEALKSGKLDKTSQEFNREYNAWRAGNGYCRATSLVLDSDMHICEAVEPQYSKDAVAVFKIAEQVEF